MKVKRKNWQQFVNGTMAGVWSFFSRPENLNMITPQDMSFEILGNMDSDNMYEGMIIQYDIRPLPGIKMRWVTEITHVRKHAYFIDEQRFGPYSLWHHQHHFEVCEGGVMMRDILHYKVPHGIIGTLADAIFVDEKIEQIFIFRQDKIRDLFP